MLHLTVSHATKRTAPFGGAAAKACETEQRALDIQPRLPQPPPAPPQCNHENPNRNALCRIATRLKLKFRFT